MRPLRPASVELAHSMLLAMKLQAPGMRGGGGDGGGGVGGGVGGGGGGDGGGKDVGSTQTSSWSIVPLVPQKSFEHDVLPLPVRQE